MTSLMSVCQKCGGAMKTGSDQFEGGINACHQRNPIEDHEFTMMVRKPTETEDEYYNRLYGEWLKDEKGHWTVYCGGCHQHVQGDRNFDFGGWFRNHLRACHPYPY